MSYLSVLNNETQSLIVVLLSISAIFMTITTLCEIFSNRKPIFNFFVVYRILNIILCVVWAFIFFNFSIPFGSIIAYYSALMLSFELLFMFIKKYWKISIDFPFLIMFFPFWKFINKTLSVIFICVGVVYLFAKSLALLLNSIIKLRNDINYYSLKESLDGLKIAVMFEDEFNVVYENLAMKNLLENLGINKKQRSFEIWQNLIFRENSKVIDEENILVFLDEKVYSFSINKKSKIQIYAFDITQEYLTTIEIENKQSELKIKQSEILEMIDNLDEFERQKEVLTLKSKLHDIIGQRLFILHHILDVIDERNFDLNNIKNMLSTMLGEIDNDDIFEIQNMQNSIVTAFEMIGFNIEIFGEMPKDTTKAKAVVKIIRECATNAIRHANATKLFVNITDDKIEIWDNGKFGKKTISEGTGIKGMRLNADVLGGQLTVSMDKGFRIVIDRYSI